MKALKLSRTETIGRLLEDNGSTIAFSAPSSGQLTIGWYLRPKGVHRPLLVAMAQVIFHTARKANVTITLTDKGRQMLEQSSHLELTARATFHPSWRSNDDRDQGRHPQAVSGRRAYQPGLAREL